MPESLAHALHRRASGGRRTGSRAPSAPRRARSVARTLERLASAAEEGARRPLRFRPPRSVVEIAAEAPGIRELAALLRAHAEPSGDVVAACDRFADDCWNGSLRALDREHHRRQLGRLRYLLLC
jgi:hypothetical protein